MPSSISSSRKAALFASVCLLCLAAAEIYSRTSSRFASGAPWYVDHVIRSDPAKAVFGDSQIGNSSYIQGYTFYGMAGQQPEELEALVRYLYRSRRADKVIVMAAPQWFGEYHTGRARVITDGALPPRWLPLRLASLHFRENLRGHVARDLRDVLSTVLGITAFARASAAEPRPSREAVLRFSREWDKAIAGASHPMAYKWSQFPDAARHTLTLSRVYEQNPRARFDDTPSAQAYERAIKFVIERGGKVCLFRPPVTTEYLKLAGEISDSRFDLFETYVEALRTRLGLTYVDFRTLDMVFSNDRFVNQDHLNYDAHALVWPKVVDRCFGSGSALPRG